MYRNQEIQELKKKELQEKEKKEQERLLKRQIEMQHKIEEQRRLIFVFPLRIQFLMKIVV